MGIIDYGDNIRRAKNRIFNLSKKPKKSKSPEKPPKSTEISAPKKKFVDQPQTSNLKTPKNILTSAILLTAGLAAFLTLPII